MEVTVSLSLDFRVGEKKRRRVDVTRAKAFNQLIARCDCQHRRAVSESRGEGWRERGVGWGGGGKNESSRM